MRDGESRAETNARQAVKWQADVNASLGYPRSREDLTSRSVELSAKWGWLRTIDVASRRDAPQDERACKRQECVAMLARRVSLAYPRANSRIAGPRLVHPTESSCVAT